MIVKKRDPDDVEDHLDLHLFKAQKKTPEGKDALMAAVGNASKPIRALGENYSLSKIGVAENGTVILPNGLDKHLCQPFPKPAKGLASERLRGDADGNLWGKLILDAESVKEKHFVYVEAGLHMKQLLADLQVCGLAVPTMGAGGGQRLGGALSTSTHGGDFDIKVLGDAVRAIHLVTPAGEERWITPGKRLFGPPFSPPAPKKGIRSGDAILGQIDAKAAAAFSRLQKSFSGNAVAEVKDERVIADDQVFHAVLVSMGRMGVIYAVVLEVLPAYHLIEVNREEKWDKVRALLQPVANGMPPLLTEANLDVDKFLVAGKELARKERENKATVKERQDLLDSCMGKDFSKSLRHANIVINLANPAQCWITRRWELGRAADENFLQSFQLKTPEAQKTADARTKAVFNIFKKYKDDPVGLIQNEEDLRAIIPEKYQDAAFRVRKAVFSGEAIPDDLAGKLVGDLVSLGDVLGLANETEFAVASAVFSPLVTLLVTIGSSGAMANKLQPVVVNLIYLVRNCLPPVDKEQRLFEFAFLLVHRIFHHPKLKDVLDEIFMKSTIESRIGFELSPEGLANFLTGQLFGGEFGKCLRVDLATKMFDTHNYAQDELASAHSAEFFFDATQPGYLDFIKKVTDFAVLEGNKPVFGYIGIRFMPESAALLAMQRFTRTVSVEVTTVHSRVEEVQKNFLDAVHGLARESGGGSPRAIPHWGQEFRHTAAEIDEIYGPRLNDWKKARAHLDPKDRFETTVSRDLGLEGPSL